MVAVTHRVLLVSGSLRRGSTNTALLRTAQAVAPRGVETVIYQGMDRLPHFNPDDDAEPLHPEVAELRSHVGACDALVLSTPEYAGALPGSFKNVLDWTVGSIEMYEKPVAWINVSTGPTGGADAHASLRKVLGYISAVIVEQACRNIPVRRDAIDADGLIADSAVLFELTAALDALETFLKARS